MPKFHVTVAAPAPVSQVIEAEYAIQAIAEFRESLYDWADEAELDIEREPDAAELDLEES